MNKPAHILLVEDNRMDVELTLDAFREDHLESQVSASGPERKPWTTSLARVSTRIVTSTPCRI